MKEETLIALGALAVALITPLVSLAAIRLTAQQDRNKYLFDKKAESYEKALEAALSFSLSPANPSAWQSFRTGLSKAQIFGSQEVKIACEKITRSGANLRGFSQIVHDPNDEATRNQKEEIDAAWRKTFDELLDAIRKETA